MLLLLFLLLFCRSENLQNQDVFVEGRGGERQVKSKVTEMKHTLLVVTRCESEKNHSHLGPLWSNLLRSSSHRSSLSPSFIYRFGSQSRLVTLTGKHQDLTWVVEPEAVGVGVAASASSGGPGKFGGSKSSAQMPSPSPISALKRFQQD